MKIKSVLNICVSVLFIISLFSMSFSDDSSKFKDGDKEVRKGEISPVIEAAIADLDVIGEKKNVDEIYNNGELSYKVAREYELIGYEPVLANFTRVVQKCHDELNESKKAKAEEKNIDILADPNLTLDVEQNLSIRVCIDVNETYESLDYTSKSKPIYAAKDAQKIIVGSKEVNLSQKGCWICGKYLACLSRKDGYAENRAEIFKCDSNNYPILRSGESGWIKDTSSDKILYSNTNVGEIQ